MKNNKEQKLNDLFSSCYSVDEALDNFIYLTNKSRGKHTTEQNIIIQYHNRKLGSLLKRLDPIAFNCADD
jgi:hypothetical protein